MIIVHSQESSEKLLHALLITQISKEDYRDFWTFSEISSKMTVQRVIAVVRDSILAGLYKELGVETVCSTDLVIKELLQVTGES
jgi:hypothetical protein